MVKHHGALLAAVLTLAGAVLCLNVLFMAGRLASGHGVSFAVESTGLHATLALGQATRTDSWLPMSQAYAAHKEGESPYRVFFADGIKYQYPPTALLIYEVLPSRVWQEPDGVARGSRFNAAITWISRLAVLATMAAAALILMQRAVAVGSPERGRVAAAAAFGVAGLLYYPLLYGHLLGQIQVFLNLLLVLALLAWCSGKSSISGVLLGVCALIKPQYAVVGLWLLLARQWIPLAWMAATGLAGLLCSLAIYGLDVHLQYLEVLSRLSRVGEAYWSNQSMNGVMHRLTGNGDAIVFDPDSFPPYSRTVHIITVLSSALILLLALVTARGHGSSEPRYPHGLGAMLAGLTLASPIAWEHHYGFFLGLVALLLPALWQRRGAGWLLLVTTFVATACSFRIPAWMLTSSLGSIPAGHLYFGGLAIFGLLVVESLRQPPRDA